MIHDPKAASADSLRVLVKILRPDFFFNNFNNSVFTVSNREIPAIPDGHHLDKSDVHRKVFRERNKGADIVFAECQRYGIDFHTQA